MKRLVAVEKIGDAARVVWRRAPRGADKHALHCLAWAKENCIQKCNAYVSGQLNGVLSMSSHGAGVSPEVASALWMAAEALWANGDVPGDQVEAAIAALNTLYLTEDA